MSLVKRKFANLPNWPRLIKKRFGLTRIDDAEFKGYISIVYIDKVTRPLILKITGKELCLVDDGYIWTQYFPQGEKYALTTMFNVDSEVVEWYFDICAGNKINYKGVPYYDDLYLDVVVLPSGEIDLLDEDELKEALKFRDITAYQYDMAYKEAKKLIKSIKCGENKLLERSKNDLEFLKSLPTR